MKDNKHYARKRFGQNFLHDNNIIANIIRLFNAKETDTFVEIGPGFGALTKPLLQIVKSLDVIELDRDIIPHLKVLCEDLGELRVHQIDALKFQLAELSSKPHHLRLVGNLPYNISSPLIFHLLSQRNLILDMHFMLQKEVVDRMVAQSGNKTYGRLSIMTQYYCRAEKLLTIGPHAFIPPPKVDSAIIRLIPHKTIENPAQDEQHFALIVREAFNHRRKTIHNSLKNIIPTGALEKSNISPSIRAEQLSIDDFVRLANVSLMET